jgi:uncharacterized protein YuzE
MYGDFAPALRVSVDENTGGIRTAYLRIRPGEVAETREVADGRAFADYSNSGQLLGIEILAACDVATLDGLAAGEPEAVRRFLRGGTPRELVTA